MGFPYHGPNVGDFSAPQPQIWKFFNGTPQRHFLTSKHAFWAIVRQDTSIGATCRRAEEKNKKIKNRKVFWRRCHPSRWVPSPYRNFTIFGQMDDVITCAKFHVNPSTHFGSARGQIFHFHLWEMSRLYNSLALPGRLWWTDILNNTMQCLGKTEFSGTQ